MARSRIRSGAGIEPDALVTCALAPRLVSARPIPYDPRAAVAALPPGRIFLAATHPDPGDSALHVRSVDAVASGARSRSASAGLSRDEAMVTTNARAK